MLETATGIMTKEINAVRAELHRFQNQQSDAAVQLHCIAIDTNLAAALDGQNDASFREILASNVEHLRDAIRTKRLRNTPAESHLGISRLSDERDKKADHVPVNSGPNLLNSFGASISR